MPIEAWNETDSTMANGMSLSRLSASALASYRSIQDGSRRSARMSKSLKTILSVSFARGYGTVLSLLTLFISARYLGPDGRGTFVAAIAWAALFATFCNLSLGQALQYRLQSTVGGIPLASQVGTLAGLALAVSLFALGVAVLCFAVTDGSIFKGLNPTVLVIAFAALPLLVWEQFSSNILSAASRLDIYNRAQYFGRTGALVLFLALVAGLELGVPGALAAQAAGLVIVATLVAIPLLRLAGDKPRWAPAEVKPLISAGMKLHITTVSAVVLDQVSILMINNYLTKADVGYFQLAQQMIALMLILPQSALMVIYGGMAESDPNQFWPQHRRLVAKVVLILIAISAFAYALAPSLVVAVAGEQFAPTAPLFRAMLPTLIGLSLAILLTPQWVGRGLFLLNNVLTIATAVVVVAATYYAIPEFGLDGVIWIRLAVYAGVIPIVQVVFSWWCNSAARAARCQK